MTPVNLAVDSLASSPPPTTMALIEAMSERPLVYRDAATKIGLTSAEYVDFRTRVEDGRASYGVLPHHLDAMAGRHRSGQVYALRNVEVPAATMGWKVTLADGATVWVPQRCGNLSMVRAPRRVAAVPRKPFANTPAYGYHPAPTPVVFTPPVGSGNSVPVPAPVAAPAAPAPIVAKGSALPFLGLLFPAIAGLLHGGGHTAYTAPAATIVPPCSMGSNEYGGCQK